MKSLSFGCKVLFFINNIFAFCLLISYLTAFISPGNYPITGILNFSIPFLWGINGFFALIWLLKLKKHLFLSLIIMAIGWFQMKNIFVIPSNTSYAKKGIKVMSYNVMQFYSLKEKRKSTYKEIEKFIDKENIDILCFQEFKAENDNIFPNFKYKLINNDSTQLKTSILSKYPIINQHHYDFGISNNSGVYADVVLKNDTIRVFSVHFESLNLRQDIDQFTDEPKNRLLKRLSRTFKRQIEQLNEIQNEIKTSPYPVIFSADMNNTALSHLYRRLNKLNLKDTFTESGSLYGKTFSFFDIPVRIDMIFIDDALTSLQFKNYKVDYSDHRPVMAEIGL